MKTKRIWLIIALINFLLAAGMGALLRLAFVVELPWFKYKFLLHAHSHVAMLGWIYMALFALLIHAFVPEGKSLQRYGQLFWFTQVSVIGMLLSFPVQGYGPVSIAFSTIHILLSYLFIWWLWKDIGPQRTFSRTLLKTALFFQFFSTLGIWLMGPIMASPLRHSSFYHLAVQFYLHFQFNGWFILAILAVFFKLSEHRAITFPRRKLQVFYGLLISSVFLTYALAVVWATQATPILLVNSAGGILQLLALGVFLQLIWPVRARHQEAFTGLASLLLALAFFSFCLKVGMQALVAVPMVAEAAYTIRNYMIGFIHLLLLGTMTFFLLSYMLREQFIPVRSPLSRWGIGLIITGFILSELLLFLQGSLQWGQVGFMPAYYESLFGVSVLIPLGIFLLIVNALGTYSRWGKDF